MLADPSKSRPPSQTGSFAEQLAARKSTAAPVAVAGRLVADRDEIKNFLNSIFKRCQRYVGKAHVVLQGLQHQPNRSILFDWRSFDSELVDAASHAATTVANRSPDQAAVFCVPPMLFGEKTTPKGRRFAGAANVICNPVINVELDDKPAASLRSLETHLGPATLVVASGGTSWGQDGPEDRLHAYWRLAEPAVGNEDLARLKRARKAAAVLVGADKTAVPLCHPMRLPGSWHRKSTTPRLCRIVRSGDNEVGLTDALEKLESIVGVLSSGGSGDKRGSSGFSTPRPWPAEALTQAAQTIPNTRLPWDEWNRLLMVFYDASHGSSEGLEAAHAFSEKCAEKYDAADTDGRWDHFASSPPTSLADRTLLYEARKTDRDFVDPVAPGAADFFDDLGELPEGQGVSSLFDTKPEPAHPMPALRVVAGLVDPTGLPVREWLIQPRYPIGDVSQCVGEPGISKSTVMLRDALVVATGREDILRGKDRNGQPITRERLHASGPVIVYNAEDRVAEMERRLTAAQTHYGVTAADMKHPIVLWSGVDAGTLTIMRRDSDRGPMKRAPGADILERAVREHGAMLVVLDPQISLTAGSHENSNDDQDALLQEIAIMATRCGAAFAVVQHTSKTTRNAKGDMGAGRGAFSAVGKVRSAFTLVKVTGEDDEQSWNLPPGDASFRLDYAKVSHDRKPTEPIIFRRISAPVGNGLGVKASAATAMFDDNPREALRAAGDFAPVIEIVDLKTHAEAAATKPRNEAEARRIAEVVCNLMGGTTEMPLGDLWSAIGVRMREEGICDAKHRPAVTGHIVSALAGDGAEIDRAGQTVRVRVSKKKPGDKSPWWLSIDNATGQAAAEMTE